MTVMSCPELHPRGCKDKVQLTCCRVISLR